MSKTKKPKQKEKISRKQAKSNYNGDSFYDKYPNWRFSKRDKSHDRWGINVGEFDKILVEKLESFETMTWQEILSSTAGRKNNTRNHFIECDNLTNEAQKQLKKIKLYEKAEGSFCSLALTGEIRLWGILIDGIFEIVWLDNNHEVYKVSKNHT